MFGVGPGALPTDAYMIGIQPSEQRRMLDEGMDAIMHLLRSDEPLTMRTDWFDLRNAKSQLAAVPPTSRSRWRPSPRRRGRASPASTASGCCRSAPPCRSAPTCWPCTTTSGTRWPARTATTADRQDWRLVGVFHCAETREQALRDVEYGIEHWFDYLQHTAAAPQFVPVGDTLQERIAWVNETGVGAIGTAEDCIRQIERLWKQSGGFGTYLCMDHDFANPAATKARSYELMAQRVMPHFQTNTFARLNDAARRAQSVRQQLNDEQAKAIEDFTAQHPHGQ